MRLTFAALVLLFLPAIITAQSRRPATPPAPSLPSIGLPLPPIGLPLPALGLPRTVPTLPGRTGDAPVQVTGNRRQRGGDGQRSRRGTAVVIVPGYGYGWGYPFAPAPVTSSAPLPGRPVAHADVTPTGRLRLDVQHGQDAQIYVDGYFTGTSNDVGGELQLEPGPHRIELRAAGYETLALSVKVDAGRSITYRGALEPVGGTTPPAATAQPVPDTPARPTTVYFIPGCYLGNVPPKDARLPATCDQSRVTTFEP